MDVQMDMVMNPLFVARKNYADKCEHEDGFEHLRKMARFLKSIRMLCTKASTRTKYINGE